jgi:hypothetical protein
VAFGVRPQPALQREGLGRLQLLAEHGSELRRLPQRQQRRPA